MGLSSSKDISKMVTTIVSNVTNDTIVNSTTDINNSQIISVNCAGGNVVIDGNKLDIEFKVDLNATLDALNDSDTKQDLQDTIAQTSKSLIKDINIGNIGLSASVINDIITATVNITNNINQTCKIAGGANQIIKVEHASGDVAISNNTFSQAVSVISNCVAKSTSSSKTIQDLQQKVDQLSTTSVAGFSIWGLATIAGIVVGGIAFAALAPVLVPLIASGKNPKLIGFFFVLISIVFFVIYFVWTNKTMKSTLWAKPLSGTCQGQITVIKQVNVANADAAAQLASKTKNCAGYDFVASQVQNNTWTQVQPKVILYSSADILSCKLVPDDSPILTNRSIFFDTKQSQYPDEAVYFDYQGYKIYNKTRNAWSEYKKMLPASSFLKSIKIGDTTTQLDPTSSINLYTCETSLDLTSFSLVQISNGSPSTVAGPGRMVNTTLIPNVSGVQVLERKKWALYAGIGVGLVGLVIIALVKPKKSKSKKSKEEPKE